MNLIFIMGDQLSRKISALEGCEAGEDVILMCEVTVEATYVKHHKKKIAFLFSAMRHFAEELREIGHTVRYVKLDDPNNSGSFSGEAERAVKDLSPDKIILTEPSEYRVLETVRSWNFGADTSVAIREDTRFLATKDFFADWAADRKSLTMEYFYREMRKRHDILMDGDRPEGGSWNYDSENRKSPPKNLSVPAPYKAQIDDITNAVIDLVADHFSDHFGDLENFHYGVTRDQALNALKKFVEERLPNFGDYQDAMVEGEPWMYHSHISLYMNAGLLDARECIEAAETAYKDGKAPLNAAEGFIRQILGWREYVRGLYWLKMPDYQSMNKLSAERPLPPLFWGAPTKMNCLSQCVSETKANAYAHHIQRLMVLGNFALLTGLDPDEVNEWYLIVYADAFHWVELPNVTGMILFADGGLMASKPYAASGAYINRMSNYCKNCSYKVSQKNGPQACPFNYLYWDFLDRNREKLEGNPRLGMPYRNLDKMDDEKLTALRSDARRFLKAMDNGETV